MNKNIVIRQIQVKEVMSKSNAPIGGYCVNPYVGCTHGCKYCYASFMKRFTGHTEEWGTFLDVKNWQPIKNLDKFKGEHIIIGTVTDGYLPEEAKYNNTRKLLEQLVGVDAYKCQDKIPILLHLIFLNLFLFKFILKPV